MVEFDHHLTVRRTVKLRRESWAQWTLAVRRFSSGKRSLVSKDRELIWVETSFVVIVNGLMISSSCLGEEGGFSRLVYLHQVISSRSVMYLILLQTNASDKQSTIHQMNEAKKGIECSGDKRLHAIV